MLTNHLWSRYAGPEITAKFATGEAKWTDPGVVQGFAKRKEWVDRVISKKVNWASSMPNIPRNLQAEKRY